MFILDIASPIISAGARSAGNTAAATTRSTATNAAPGIVDSFFALPTASQVFAGNGIFSAILGGLFGTLMDPLALFQIGLGLAPWLGPVLAAKMGFTLSAGVAAGFAACAPLSAYLCLGIAAITLIPYALRTLGSTVGLCEASEKSLFEVALVGGLNLLCAIPFFSGLRTVSEGAKTASLAGLKVAEGKAVENLSTSTLKEVGKNLDDGISTFTKSISSTKEAMKEGVETQIVKLADDVKLGTVVKDHAGKTLRETRKALRTKIAELEKQATEQAKKEIVKRQNELTQLKRLSRKRAQIKSVLKKAQVEKAKLVAAQEKLAKFKSGELKSLEEFNKTVNITVKRDIAKTLEVLHLQWYDEAGASLNKIIKGRFGKAAASPVDDIAKQTADDAAVAGAKGLNKAADDGVNTIYDDLANAKSKTSFDPKTNKPISEAGAYEKFGSARVAGKASGSAPVGSPVATVNDDVVVNGLSGKISVDKFGKTKFVAKDTQIIAGREAVLIQNPITGEAHYVCKDTGVILGKLVDDAGTLSLKGINPTVIEARAMLGTRPLDKALATEWDDLTNQLLGKGVLDLDDKAARLLCHRAKTLNASLKKQVQETAEGLIGAAPKIPKNAQGVAKADYVARQQLFDDVAKIEASGSQRITYLSSREHLDDLAHKISTNLVKRGKFANATAARNKAERLAQIQINEQIQAAKDAAKKSIEKAKEKYLTQRTNTIFKGDDYFTTPNGHVPVIGKPTGVNGTFAQRQAWNAIKTREAQVLEQSGLKGLAQIDNAQPLVFGKTSAKQLSKNITQVDKAIGTVKSRIETVTRAEKNGLLTKGAADAQRKALGKELNRLKSIAQKQKIAQAQGKTLQAARAKDIPKSTYESIDQELCANWTKLTGGFHQPQNYTVKTAKNVANNIVGGTKEAAGTIARGTKDAAKKTAQAVADKAKAPIKAAKKLLKNPYKVSPLEIEKKATEKLLTQKAIQANLLKQQKASKDAIEKIKLKYSKPNEISTADKAVVKFNENNIVRLQTELDEIAKTATGQAQVKIATQELLEAQSKEALRLATQMQDEIILAQAAVRQAEASLGTSSFLANIPFLRGLSGSSALSAAKSRLATLRSLHKQLLAQADDFAKNTSVGGLPNHAMGAHFPGGTTASRVEIAAEKAINKRAQQILTENPGSVLAHLDEFDQAALHAPKKWWERLFRHSSARKAALAKQQSIAQQKAIQGLRGEQLAKEAAKQVDETLTIGGKVVTVDEALTSLSTQRTQLEKLIASRKAAGASKAEIDELTDALNRTIAHRQNVKAVQTAAKPQEPFKPNMTPNTMKPGPMTKEAQNAAKAQHQANITYLQQADTVPTKPLNGHAGLITDESSVTVATVNQSRKMYPPHPQAPKTPLFSRNYTPKSATPPKLTRHIKMESPIPTNITLRQDAIAFLRSRGVAPPIRPSEPIRSAFENRAAYREAYRNYQAALTTFDSEMATFNSKVATEMSRLQTQANLSLTA